MHKTTLLLAMLLLLVACGCGGVDEKRAEIGGTVRINGEPLATGAISFRPAEGNIGPSSGGAINKGAYHVPLAKGVAIGKNRVIISSVIKTGRKTDRGDGMLEDEQLQVIPPQYNQLSELVCAVQPGSNQLDFDLKVDLTKYPLAAYLNIDQTK